jgi:hypothetical protein
MEKHTRTRHATPPNHERRAHTHKQADCARVSAPLRCCHCVRACASALQPRRACLSCGSASKCGCVVRRCASHALSHSSRSASPKPRSAARSESRIRPPSVSRGGGASGRRRERRAAKARWRRGGGEMMGTKRRERAVKAPHSGAPPSLLSGPLARHTGSPVGDTCSGAPRPTVQSWRSHARTQPRRRLRRRAARVRAPGTAA